MVRRGFTVLELMVAVCVLGTLAALAVPAYGRLRARSGVREASQRIAHHIERARALARSRRTGVPGWGSGEVVRSAGLRVVDGTRVEVYIDSGEVERPGTQAVIAGLDVHGSLRIEPENHEIRFRRNGTLSTTADEWVRVVDEDYGIVADLVVYYGGQVEIR